MSTDVTIYFLLFRPKELLLKPKSPGGGSSEATSAVNSPSGSLHLLPHSSGSPQRSTAASTAGGNASAAASRAGSPVVPTDPAVILMYGDECCYAKVSLLHFIVFFFLGGLTVIIVGFVQVGILQLNLKRRLNESVVEM